MKPKFWNKGKLYLSEKDKVLKSIIDNYPNECPIVQLQSTQYLDKKSNSIIRCKLKSIKYEKFYVPS